MMIKKKKCDENSVITTKDGKRFLIVGDAVVVFAVDIETGLIHSESTMIHDLLKNYDIVSTDWVLGIECEKFNPTGDMKISDFLKEIKVGDILCSGKYGFRWIVSNESGNIFFTINLDNGTIAGERAVLIDLLRDYEFDIVGYIKMEDVRLLTS